MKKIIGLVLVFFSVNCFAWNPFSNKSVTTSISSAEQSLLRIEINLGRGNNVQLKIYNGLSGPVWCEALRITENNSNIYDVSHPFFIPSLSIEQFTVKIFDSSKAKKASLLGCKCEKINGKGGCVIG
jgi:hypothetical protein